jgi:hypothetical protein
VYIFCSSTRGKTIIFVKQSENLVTFLFAVFLNNLEQFMEEKNITGLKSISSELEAQLEIYLKILPK